MIQKSIDTLLLQEMTETGFNRCDIIVRLLAIEEYYHKNNFGYQFYQLMQEYRFREKPHIQEAKIADSLGKFKELIGSIEKNGYQEREHPIYLNESDELMNGAHRIAACLFYNIEYLHFAYTPNEEHYRDHIKYGMEWFERYFDSYYCSIICNRMRELFKSRGGLAYAIVWPSAYEQLDQVEERINESFMVVSWKDVIFYSREDLFTFIDMVYKCDSYRPGRVSENLESIPQSPKYPIRLYQLKYPYNDRCFLTDMCGKKNMLNTKIEYLYNTKEQIRKAFSQTMNDYVFDNAFHCGDSIAENKYLQGIFNLYRQRKEL